MLKNSHPISVNRATSVILYKNKFSTFSTPLIYPSPKSRIKKIFISHVERTKLSKHTISSQFRSLEKYFVCISTHVQWNIYLYIYIHIYFPLNFDRKQRIYAFCENSYTNYIYIYMLIYTYTYICIYIYIYLSRGTGNKAGGCPRLAE